MKRSILAAAAAVALVAVAPRAHAQVANPIHVGVSGGITFPTSDAIDDGQGFSTKLKSGYNVAGHLGFQVPMFPLGLRADVGYNKFDGKDLNFDGGNLKFDQGIFSGTLNAIIKPASLLPAKPYVIGGVGMYRVKLDGDATLLGTSGSGSQSKTSFGLNGGAGINFSLGALSTFVEARYHYVFNDQKCGDTSSDSCLPRKATTFVPVSFGIMF